MPLKTDWWAKLAQFFFQGKEIKDKTSFEGQVKKMYQIEAVCGTFLNPSVPF